TDTGLGRQTRSHLAFSLVVECLHAFLEGRVPAVQYERVQQMIRSVEDEVRAHAAGAIQRFTNEISSPRPNNPSPPTTQQPFRTAAKPFLQQVWPQERSLVTPGVSRALADLPATAPGAFAEAVQAIERFLVPFDCWSMLEYGLYGEEDGTKKISRIVTRENAQ